jgi:hypothetical protein
VPALLARAATVRPSSVSDGLASAVDTGRSTALGKDAQPLSQPINNSRPRARSARGQVKDAKDGNAA